VRVQQTAFLWKDCKIDEAAMQKIPMATTLTSMSRSEKSAIVDDSDETLNSTQRFKQELIRANKSVVDSNLQTE